MMERGSKLFFIPGWLGSDDEEAIDYSYKAEASKKPIRALA